MRISKIYEEHSRLIFYTKLQKVIRKYKLNLWPVNCFSFCAKMNENESKYLKQTYKRYFLFIISTYTNYLDIHTLFFKSFIIMTFLTMYYYRTNILVTLLEFF